MGSFVDITGQVFGKLVVIEPCGKSKSGNISWLCKCSCGIEQVVVGSNLRNGNSTACGKCNKSADLTGLVFERLTVVEKVYQDKNYRWYWLCKCVCGNECVVIGSSLLDGNTKSCGCLRTEKLVSSATKHGKAKDPLYPVWQAMRSRCFNINYKCYHNYGGRGITVCDEWKNSFMAFYNWAEIAGYRKGLTLDRIDNNGNYCPENCRWVTQKENNRNTRSNHILTYKGESKLLTVWAEQLNIHPRTLSGRIERNWSTEKALTTPVRTKYKNKKSEDLQSIAKEKE